MNSNQFTNISGWLSSNEGLLLSRLTKEVATEGAIVEIGSFQGKSTLFIALALKDIESDKKVYAVDPHLGKTHVGSKTYNPTVTAFKKNISKYHLGQFVQLIRKTSVDANHSWTSPISLLFIDGLHEYKYAKQDLQLWLPHLVNGGVVVCHDAFGPFPDVWQAAEEEILSRDFYYFGVLDSCIFAFKGKPKNIMQKINWTRSALFLRLASKIWHNNKISQQLRFFVVNRCLKMFFINKFMLKEIFHTL